MSATVLQRPNLTPPPRETAQRDPWFDNAKMLLVTLVVVGHTWTLLPETAFNRHLYDWLYLWHVPAFVMLTGYLSRRFTYSRKHLRRLVTTVVIPYLVIEGVLALFRVLVGGERLELLWLNPHWPMWYLAALFAWRLATPALQRMPAAVPAAVALSLLGGLFSVEVLDLNRVLGLLPFFVIGLLATPRHLELLRSGAARRTAAAVLVAGVPLTWWTDLGISTEWLYYRTSYAELETGWAAGMGIRLLLIGVAVVMTVAALSWVPRTTSWFGRLGAASLVVYLFHGFFVLGAEYAGFESWAAEHAVVSLLAATVGSVLLALGLAWRPVAKPLEKVITPDP